MRDCNTGSRRPRVNHVFIEQEAILRNQKAASAKSSPVDEADFAARLVQSRQVDDLWWDRIDVLPEQAVKNHVEDKNREKVLMMKMQCHKMSLYVGQNMMGQCMTTYVVWLGIPSKEHKKDRISRLIDGRWKKVVFTLFDKAYERTMGSLCTPLFRVTQQAAIETLYTKETKALVDSSMYKLSESEDFT